MRWHRAGRWRCTLVVAAGARRAAVAHAAAAGYTVQRALPLAFPADTAARNVADAFMWGDALLVAPIVDGTLSRSVYVPDGGGGAPWADFHTGADVAPGAATLAAPGGGGGRPWWCALAGIGNAWCAW